MQRDGTGEDPGIGWTERVYAAFPVPPALVGMGFALSLVLVFGTSEIALDRHRAIVDADEATTRLLLFQARTAIANILLAAYLPTAYVYLLRSFRSRFAELEAAPPRPPASLAAAVGRYRNSAVVFAGIAGIAFVSLMTTITASSAHEAWYWPALIPETRWARALAPWIGGWVGLLLFAAFAEARRLLSALDTVESLDPLDLEPLRPFTGQALVTALVLVLACGFGLLAIVESGTLRLVLGFWIGTGLAILGSLVLWLRPLRRIIRSAKHTELDWCRAALIGERTKLRRGGGEPTRIAELVAWEQRIKAVHDWPLDAPALRQVLLYSLIPLGSWAGGALVERFIDSLLG